MMTTVSDAVIPEIIRNSLNLITAELKSVVMRTAYSTSWSEAGDLSCAVLNPQGELLAQGEHDIPLHLGTMPLSVRGALDVMGDDINQGDVVIHNDPRLGNNHLPDFLFLSPVFEGNTLLAFIAVRAHWADVGGTAPGSMSNSSRTSFQEGIRVPPQHLVRAGTLNQELVSLLLANVRVPDIVLGDMRAQIAGVQRGVERVKALVSKYGVEQWQTSTDRLLDQAEAGTRAGIRTLADGCYEFEDATDGDGLADGMRWVRLRLHVRGDELEADFSASDPEALGAINAPYSVTVSSTYYAVKAFLDPHNPSNSGSHRPIKVTTTKGSIVDANPDTAVAASADTANLIADVVVGALSLAAPDRGVAAGSGSAFAAFLAGPQRPSTGRAAGLYVETHGGAWGGRSVGDGISGRRIGVGNVGNQPIEVAESTYPIRILEYGLVRDTGGAGQYRGGFALRRTVLLEDDFVLTMLGDRVRRAPYGLSGGQPGETGHIVVNPGTASEKVLPSKATLPLNAGDVVLIQGAGGGGYGDPRHRSPDAIKADIADGYISPEAAQRDYPESFETT